MPENHCMTSFIIYRERLQLPFPKLRKVKQAVKLYLLPVSLSWKNRDKKNLDDYHRFFKHRFQMLDEAWAG